MGRLVTAAQRRRERSVPDAPSVDGLWRDVVAGRLVVVKQHDENGRRYLYLEAPHSTAKLTERERVAVGYRAYGQSLKRIAFELGVSVPTVARCLSRARAKMGLKNDVELSAVLGAALRRR